MKAKLNIIATTDCEKLIVEPWAHEITLVAGDTYELVAFSDQTPWFEVEYGDRTLIVYVNSVGSTYQVQCSNRLVSSSDIPIPPIP